MRFGIVVFPGSNCDRDCQYAVEKLIADPHTNFAGNTNSSQVVMIWHKEEKLPDVDVLVLPGGFSYGDYLRTGAIARISPVMKAVIPFAKEGGFVLGICNGFQILTEAGLLPGVLLRNRSLKFICKSIAVRVENNSTKFTSLYGDGEVLSFPIAHAEGNYYIEKHALARLKDNGQVVFRYCNQEGSISNEANPNGSIENIAGVCNEEGNVLGMMPHPERVSDPRLGCVDGIRLFQALIQTPRERAGVLEQKKNGK